MNGHSFIVTDDCIGCGVCVDLCPLDCLRMGENDKPYLKYDECWYCGCCEIECPVSCLKIHFPFLVF